MLSVGSRFMLLGAFFFSGMSVFAKLAGDRLPTVEIVLARVVVTLVLSGFALQRLGVSPFGNHRALLVMRGLAGFSGLSCYFYALQHLKLADAVVLQYTNPMMTAFLAVFLLKEPLRWRELFAAALSLVGVACVAQPSFLFGDAAWLSNAWLATEWLPTRSSGLSEPLLDSFVVWVALAGALFSALAYVIIRRLSRTEHTMVIVFYFPLIAGLASVPWVLTSDLLWPTPTEWLYLLGIGVTAQLGQVYMTRGLHLEPAGRATALTYVQVFFAFSWGVLFFDEPLSVLSMFGSAFIFAGTLLITYRTQRQA